MLDEMNEKIKQLEEELRENNKKREFESQQY